MLLFLAQLTIATGASAVNTPTTRARPIPRPLISSNDYPGEAVRRRWEGDVVADLTISPAGRVSTCRIVKSSGHSILDDTTCKIMLERAVFLPAADKDGRPVMDTLRTPPIEWRLSR